MQENQNQAIESSEVAVDEPIIETHVEETPLAEDIKEEIQEDVEEKEETAPVEEKENEEEGEEKFPKKAERALERRNKKINKLRAEKAELERKLQEYSQNPQPREEQVNDNYQPEGLSEPHEDDFENYADYLEAKGEYKVRKEYAAKEAQAQQQDFQQSQQQWVQERANYVNDRAAKAVETIPEFDGLYKENQDIIEGYTDHTKLAFLEAEKPELAFYALASEGKLESLEDMSPMGIAREIALAEIRGEKLSKSRPVTKAPAPIKPRKGTSTRKKTLADMSPSELIAYSKKINKR